MKVRAISLWEPWASLMRTGAKTIETRDHRISHRGPLLICAAKRRDAWAMDLLWDPDFQKGLSPLRPQGGKILPADLHFGMAVALVDLEACHRTDRVAASPVYEVEGRFGDYSPGRYAWITSNLRTFEPFPARGSQGLFSVELPLHLEALLSLNPEAKE